MRERERGRESEREREREGERDHPYPLVDKGKFMYLPQGIISGPGPLFICVCPTGMVHPQLDTQELYHLVLHGGLTLTPEGEQVGEDVLPHLAQPPSRIHCCRSREYVQRG